MKATRTRIEVVRKRAEAKQRFLKEDLAKLLANGLDINAYGRVIPFFVSFILMFTYFRSSINLVDNFFFYWNFICCLIKH